MNCYEISFPNFFGDNPNFSKILSSETAGGAKYDCYLKFSDAYDMTFIEFLKLTKCRKIRTAS